MVTPASAIRAARNRSGYTQDQLRDALGVGTGRVYRWEAGKALPRDLALLKRLATTTGMRDYERGVVSAAMVARDIKAGGALVEVEVRGPEIVVTVHWRDTGDAALVTRTGRSCGV